MKKIFLPVDGATVLYNQKHSCIHQWLFAKCMSNIYHNFLQGSKRKTTKTFGMKENVEMFISTFQGYQRILFNKAKWFYSYWFCWFRYETCIIINCSSLLWRWRVSILCLLIHPIPMLCLTDLTVLCLEIFMFWNWFKDV